jgi:hypothetical protein
MPIRGRRAGDAAWIRTPGIVNAPCPSSGLKSFYHGIGQSWKPVVVNNQSVQLLNASGGQCGANSLRAILADVLSVLVI